MLTSSSLVELSKIEFEFSSFKDVTITSTRLTGSGRNTSQQSSLVEESLDLFVNERVSGLSLSINLSGGLGEFLTFLNLTKFDTISSGEILSEGSGINFDDGILDEGLGLDKFVVGRVVDGIQNLSLSGDLFRSPGKVTMIESQGSLFGISTSNSNDSNSLFTDSGVGRRSTRFI